MSDLRFYDQLLKFQLFQGLSRSELLQLAGNTKFGFQKLPAGKPVVHEGEQSNGLLLLERGELLITTQSDDRGYSVAEQVHAPWVMQPETVFGASPRYTCSATTLTETHLITLSKDEVLRLLNDFLIFRLNLLNLLSTQAQRRGRRSWQRAPQSLRERIARFLLNHCTYPAGHKEFRILMNRLAQEVGDSRLDVSRVLNQMQSEGLLILRRGRIEVPSLEQLFM